MSKTDRQAETVKSCRMFGYLAIFLKSSPSVFRGFAFYTVRQLSHRIYVVFLVVRMRPQMVFGLLRSVPILRGISLIQPAIRCIPVDRPRHSTATTPLPASGSCYCFAGKTMLNDARGDASRRRVPRRDSNSRIKRTRLNSGYSVDGKENARSNIEVTLFPIE